MGNGTRRLHGSGADASGATLTFNDFMDGGHLKLDFDA
jgi:hypothetical protein